MKLQRPPFQDLTALKKVRRVLVAVLGGMVIALGLALIVLPGPAFLVIPAGLAILAIEFAWAKRWVRSARAILALNSKNAFSATKKRMSVQSIWRSTAFLLRQVRRTLRPKRKLA